MNILRVSTTALSALAAFVIGCNSVDPSMLSDGGDLAEGSGSSGERYYNVILLDVVDENGYDEYRRHSGPIFRGAGCQVERELSISRVRQDALVTGNPDRLIVTFCDTPDAFAELGKNEEYLQIRPMMLKSTRDFSFLSGRSAAAKTESGGGLENRLYVVKISRYESKPASRPAAEQIQSATPASKFRVETLIDVDGVYGMGDVSEVALLYVEGYPGQTNVKIDGSLSEDLEDFYDDRTGNFSYFYAVPR